MPTIEPMASDTELAMRLLHQGAAGLGDVYATYADRLFGYALTITKDPDTAGDAVHDTFLVAVDRIGQLRDPDKLRPWLFAITRNECLRRLRDRNRFATDSEEVLDAMGDEPDLTAGISRGEATELVGSALAGVSPADRDILTLALGADLDAASVGTVLGIDSKGVHARLSRARDALGAAVTALVLMRTKGRDCPDLARTLQEYPKFDPLLRKRINRHVKDCASCERRGRAGALACAPALAAPVAAVSAPAGVFDRLFGPQGSVADPQLVAAAGARAGATRPDGFPEPLALGPGPAVFAEVGSPPPPPGIPRSGGAGGRRLMLAGALAVAVILLGFVGWSTAGERSDPGTLPIATTPPPAEEFPELVLPGESPVETAAPTGAATPSSDPGSADPESKPADENAASKRGNTDTQDRKGTADEGPPPSTTPPSGSDTATTDSERPDRDTGSKSGGGGDPNGAKDSPPTDSGTKNPKPNATPKPTPAPSSPPTPPVAAPPAAPRITGFTVTDLDLAGDGSFTRCDGFRLALAISTTGQTSSAVADYGPGSFALSRAGNEWRGTTNLAPGEYTVTVTVTGPGGQARRSSASVLHICPG